MEAEDSRTSRVPTSSHGLLLAATPGLLISIGYIDPGKWAACIDSGAQFGDDLVTFMLVFNFVAILCQYLSARIGMVSGKNLAQISSEEYDRPTCIFLGVQAELSMISLDLTMIIGIAHGLHMIFGVDLFSCILFTALNAVLYPIFSILLEHSKAMFLLICLAGITYLCYVLGMLISFPEFPAPQNALLSKFSGENAFALMSLLGASVMPHNFYLHSSIVQRNQGAGGASKGTWSHDNFFATFIIFSGIFLVNYVLVNSAANVLYSTGLGLLTLQDAVSLIDHAFRSPIAPVFFFMIMFLANQITALTWEFCGEGGQTMLHDFFGMDLPGWLHCATVRIFSVVLALFCLWHSGAEGIYQVMIFSQVIVALLLPSAVIPLFRIAFSRPVMGVEKISPVMEFVVLITFMGMVGLEVIFVVEMIFGDSDWVGSLRWDTGNTISVPYILLLLTACVSLCFMLWLAATPLKSASAVLDAQEWYWQAPQFVSERSTERELKYTGEPGYQDEVLHPKQEQLLSSPDISSFSHSETTPANYDFNLPDTIMDTDVAPYLTTTEEDTAINVPSTESVSSIESLVSNVVNEATDVHCVAPSNLNHESADTLEKTVRIERELPMEKDKEKDTWDQEESSKPVSLAGMPATSDGPGSLRNLSGKNDEGGSSVGSLSRLSGLGRAARRQLAAILDEFWGQLYDFHGQVTQEAKARKLNLLLGIESKPSSLAKSDSMGKEFGTPFISDKLINTSSYDLQNANLMRKLELPYGLQRESSSIWSNDIPSLVQVPARSTLNSGEKQYLSLRLPPSSDALEYQPRTVHGYQFASYLRGMNEDRSDYMDGPLMSASSPKSPALVLNNNRDSLAFSLHQKGANGFGSVQSSTFQNPSQTRNVPLQPETAYYNSCSVAPVENMASQNYTKKYHSLPDISGLTLPLRDSYSSSMGLAPAVGQASFEPSSFSTVGSGAVGPLAFDELSPSRSYTDTLSSRIGSGPGACSLWARQPYEQFGLLNNTSSVATDLAQNGTSLMTQEAPSIADTERKLLQSLRHCILKLLKLEGSEWLFRSNDGLDEDLIERVAARERFVYEVETGDTKMAQMGDSQQSFSEYVRYQISSVPQCGESCIWKLDLIACFGVWCIHRILELSLMESRPELWGKYTYVLNRLQGVIDPAFFKPRTLMSPCFCLEVPASYQPRSTPPVSNGMLPPAIRPAKGKSTTAAMILDMIKDIEIAISCRKGRSGTAAGDVAFPKGKENLASVLKRYKRRLSNKTVKPGF